VLRRIFVPKRDETIRGRRKPYDVTLHNLYPSPDIMNKSRRMKWARHAAHMRRRGMHTGAC
jgi:hypothetical protein